MQNPVQSSTPVWIQISNPDGSTASNYYTGTLASLLAAATNAELEFRVNPEIPDVNSFEATVLIQNSSNTNPASFNTFYLTFNSVTSGTDSPTWEYYSATTPNTSWPNSPVIMLMYYTGGS